MSEVKHTPGPWKVRDESDYFNIVTVEDYVIARLHVGRWLDNREEVKANARLMASAPEMLAELATLRERCERAEAENRKLRDAWPASGDHVVYRCASGKFFRFGDDTLYESHDDAINAAAGIGGQS